MEQNFQTSFIPKKPIVEERTVEARPVNFFVVVSIFIFFTILLASVGIYFYEKYLSGQIVQMDSTLNKAKSRFEPSKIVQLQVLNKRLRASTEVLAKHVAISPIFKVLQDITMKTVRYTKFSYDFSLDKAINVNIRMSGLAIGYRSIALQADLFGKNKNIINPIFSNLSLDDRGNVIFDLDFSVVTSFIDYKKMLEITNENSNNPVPVPIPNNVN